MTDLREERLYKLSQGTYTARWAHDEIQSLQAENAKLRELASNLAQYPEGTVRGDNAYAQLCELLEGESK